VSSNTVFMFSGQGSQSYQMGRQLFEGNAVFREWMLRLDALSQQMCGARVIDAIYSSSKAEVFDQTRLTHPAIFMIEYSLAQCLMHEGVKPDLTLGTSLGSFAAAAVAGYLHVEDAMAAVLEQAAAFEASCERGGMIAILAEPKLYEEAFLSECSEMAGVNLASHFAVSAPQAKLRTIESTLKQHGVTHQRLAVSFAFHSRWIDDARARFVSFMRSVPRHQGRLPLVCCEQAATLTQLPEDFFWRVVRQPIRFWNAVAHLERCGAHRYIDVGPSGTLATFVKYGLPKTSESSAHAILTPYGQDQKNLSALLESCRSPAHFVDLQPTHA
jgi:bacillaene synthase trans-acting acyltransferase